MLIFAGIKLTHEGDGFASGVIDLGGLQVTQISAFNKVWSTRNCGLDNKGATIF
ncbi:putative vacuolar protein sorting-associated protein [Lupinus albus]|uniref:Putative vacuolar protein sorting-associated protein n=1 Tax=Lupinus albus TaxID=3870 RepID=A0A6A4MUY7_LUPAL|nr:putative vacuolar protein sorting-associated protein [Lupinus albus]